MRHVYKGGVKTAKDALFRGAEASKKPEKAVFEHICEHLAFRRQRYIENIRFRDVY